PNTVIWNIVVLLLVLTFLIFVHEFGHFIIGKIFGVHIYEFSLGMGPKVLGFKRKNDPTEYNLRALPIGGYCALAGENGEDDENLPKDKFMCNKGKLQRVAILVAGVTMNFITAFILLFFISFIWGSTEQSSIIGYIEPDSPAEKAGLTVGDRIIECNGYKVSTWDKLSVVTSLKNDNEYFEYIVRHKDGKEEKYQIIPDEYVVLDDESIKITEDRTIDDITEVKYLKKDEIVTSKLIGIGTNKEVKHGFVNAFNYACKKFASLISTMLLVVWSLITGKLGLNALSGPVGMYGIVNTVAAYGLSNILYFAAYISINLGIINILPFPAFDGGRVVFVGIEAITGKKVDPKVEGYFHTVGFMLLMLLMLYVTWHDIVKLIF
ncbi:MAG: RIP metalloprotease RseP, partial [Bacilli bacterium]|nr:RIP metalloprotease RseP [Bacilli bacterium]